MQKRKYTKIYILIVMLIKILISVDIIFALNAKLIIFYKVLTDLFVVILVIKFENSFIIHINNIEFCFWFVLVNKNQYFAIQ